MQSQNQTAIIDEPPSDRSGIFVKAKRFKILDEFFAEFEKRNHQNFQQKSMFGFKTGSDYIVNFKQLIIHNVTFIRFKLISFAKQSGISTYKTRKYHS